MGMSDFYGPADDCVCLEAVNRAIDIGVDFLDTADMYGVGGANERLLSQVLAKRRDEVVIATKFGNVRGPDGAFLGIDGRPEYVRSACDASLKRLGVDHIDLYYQHRVDRSVPIEETVGAMADLVKAGKVRHLALAWLLARGPHIVPIPGTRRVVRLEENAAAASITLSAADERAIDGVLAARKVAGTRYPAAGMASVNA